MDIFLHSMLNPVKKKWRYFVISKEKLAGFQFDLKFSLLYLKNKKWRK